MEVSQSQKIMHVVDRLPKAMRKLVHEYGVVIVTRFMEAGYDDAHALQWELEAWRKRRQEEMLK